MFTVANHVMLDKLSNKPIRLFLASTALYLGRNFVMGSIDKLGAQLAKLAGNHRFADEWNEAGNHRFQLAKEQDFHHFKALTLFVCGVIACATIENYLIDKECLIERKQLLIERKQLQLKHEISQLKHEMSKNDHKQCQREHKQCQIEHKLCQYEHKQCQIERKYAWW